MSRPKKTVEQRKATRERILAAASELLEKRGSEEISIRAVTAGLGISPMGFYSYFTSRGRYVKGCVKFQNPQQPEQVP